MDSLVMLSADFLSTYCFPFLSRIAERYAPLTLHSCGWLPQLIPTICAASFINGLHLGQMTLGELVAAGLDGRIVVIPAGVSVDTLPVVTRLARERHLRVNATVGGLWCSPQHEGWTAAETDAMRDVHERRVLPCMS
jgi:hypothetical protein